MDKEALHAIDRDILAEIWTSAEAMRNEEALVGFGSRAGGTPGERQSAEYLAAKLREYGLENVHLHEYEWNGWIRGTIDMQVTAPVKEPLDGISLVTTQTADIEGEVLYLGHGTPAEYEAAGEAIRGKIVLINAKSPPYHRIMHRMERYSMAYECGAIGMLWMRGEPGFLVETGSLRADAYAEMPGATISYEVGQRLLWLAKHHGTPVRVRINVANTCKRLPSWNVVGDIPGATEPDKVIIAGAHVDGHDIAVGAMDDAAGACVVWEAARALARHKGKFAKTLRFIGFSNEEPCLVGAYHYVADHMAEMKNVEFMFNLDGAGREGSKDIALMGWSELLPYFRAISKDMLHPMIVDNKIGMYSDMFPFFLQGVPSGYFNVLQQQPLTRGWGHTIADTLDKVTLRGLQGDAVQLARILARMAARSGPVAAHKTRQEVKEILAAEGLDEVLKLEKRYPF